MSTVQSTVESIGPNTAKSMLEISHYSHQRPVRDYRVYDLSLAMKRGTFAPGTAIQLAHVNDGWVLLDGQHRLRAVVDSGVEQTFVVVRHFGVSEDQAADLYGTTDRHLTRTPFDDAVAHGIPEKTGLGMTQINALGAASEFILNNFRSTGKNRTPIDVRRRAILDWADHYKKYYSYTSPSQTGRLWLRAPSIAVGMVIVMYSKDDRCENFWRGCASDDGLRNGDPRKALIRWLGNSSVSGMGAVGRRDGRVATRPKQARAVATAWNAFYEERSLIIVKVATPDAAPINILGTPYNGIDND